MTGITVQGRPKKPGATLFYDL